MRDIFEINYEFWLIVVLINIIFLVLNSLVLMFINKDTILKSFIWKTLILLILLPIYFYITNQFLKIEFVNFVTYFWFPSVVLIVISLLVTSSNFVSTKKGKRKSFIKKTPFNFVLKTKGSNNITFSEPFDNFLVYGGANSGKTKSLGRPLANEFIRHNFAGFFFDYKDRDYTKAIYYMNGLRENPLPFYYLNFSDLDYSYRTNIIKKSILTDHAELMQIMEDIFSSFMGADSKKDEWYGGALGILKGVATRIYYDYPKYLTLPHIFLYCLNEHPHNIAIFCLKRPESATYAAVLKNALDSPKMLASYVTSLQRPITDFASNKKIAYVLNGDDFDFNLIDPKEPKLFAVSNSYQIENLISPVISAMISVSSRKFTMKNKVNFVYFLDEATTFKIPDFEKMPSVLREYLCAFVFITQSNSKVEKRYDRLDRSSIEANFANQFYGRSKDVKANRDYVQVFSKIEELKFSQTKGQSTRNTSTSITKSIHDKDKYFTDVFGKLTPGNFIGTASNSNYEEFDLQFRQFEPFDFPEVPIVRKVSDWDIEKNYTKILQDITYLK